MIEPVPKAGESAYFVQFCLNLPPYRRSLAGHGVNGDFFQPIKCIVLSTTPFLVQERCVPTTTNPEKALLYTLNGASRWNFPAAVGTSYTSPSGLGADSEMIALTIPIRGYSLYADPHITSTMALASTARPPASMRRSILATILTWPPSSTTRAAELHYILYGYAEHRRIMRCSLENPIGFQTDQSGDFGM